jgi:putative spermidine/putrescine transport system permease protein
MTTQSPRQRRRGFGSPWSWLIFLLGLAYFFVPLLATLLFSLKAKPDFAAYTNSINDPGFVEGLGYAFAVGILTIVTSLLIIVPTAYWVRLRLPRLRPIVEFVTLMPFVIPPIILVFGLIRIYSQQPLVLTATELGSWALLVFAYVILSFPYMYRAVDVGLASIDVRTLTEAAQSMGAGWARILWQLIFPNLRAALLSGAFLTLAIVLGEYTIASFLRPKMFGPYLSLVGQNKAYEPAAVSLISFALTWLAMGAIAFLGRGARTRVQVAGAR